MVVFPVWAHPGLDHHLVPLEEADAHQVVSQDLVDPEGQLIQQLLHIQDGDDMMPDLADQAELFRPALFGPKELRVLQGHADLLADGGQQLHILIGELAMGIGHGKEGTHHPLLCTQWDAYHRVEPRLPDRHSGETLICGSIFHHEELTRLGHIPGEALAHL